MYGSTHGTCIYFIDRTDVASKWGSVRFLLDDTIRLPGRLSAAIIQWEKYVMSNKMYFYSTIHKNNMATYVHHIFELIVRYQYKFLLIS